MNGGPRACRSVARLANQRGPREGRGDQHRFSCYSQVRDLCFTQAKRKEVMECTREQES